MISKEGTIHLRSRGGVFDELGLAVDFVVAVAAGLGIAAVTEKGRTFLAFAKEARIEVRKVVWPTRQETTHTTLIVMVATVIMALILWGLDGILFRAVGFLTGLEI